jgi:hypothetical protein
MAHGNPQDPRELRIADDLYVRFVKIAELREQDINAQVMQPRHFDRLTENVRLRGALESLPYCYQPGGEGPIEIVSGHHRTRAARAAGLAETAVLVDTRPMRRSEIIAKQIAHNELHGDPDQQILAQLVSMIDNVDDLLATGLSEEHLPTVEPDDTTLSIPRGEFDWRIATLVFLPHQMDDFKDVIEVIDSATDVVGVAPAEQFEAFASAVYAYGRCKNVTNFTTMVTLLTDIARREIEEHHAAEHAENDDDTPQAGAA